MFIMKKVKKLVVGNWKMNPVSLEEARKVVGTVKRNMRKVRRTEVVFCPPFVYLSPLSKTMKGNLILGAQDANSETAGPFTGEVGHLQLPQFGVKYVIVGHSERRNMGETDKIVNKKIQELFSFIYDQTKIEYENPPINILKQYDLCCQTCVLQLL